MKEEYRIMKYYHRDNDTGAVKSTYHIEVLKRVRGRYLEWVPYYHSEVRHPIHGMFRTEAVFKSLKAAKKYLKNLEQPLHAPEQVK